MRQELVAGLVLFIRKSRPGVPLSSASPPVSNCKFLLARVGRVAGTNGGVGGYWSQSGGVT